MEKPGPTQLSGPAPSSPEPTKSWVLYQINCLLLSPYSLFEQQHFLIYETKTVCVACVWCYCLWGLFPLIKMNQICILSVFSVSINTHKHTYTTCSSYVPLCVSLYDPNCNSFPSAHRPCHSTPSHTHCRHGNGVYLRANDDFARCIWKQFECGCHGHGDTWSHTMCNSALYGVQTMCGNTAACLTSIPAPSLPVHTKSGVPYCVSCFLLPLLFEQHHFLICKTKTLCVAFTF